MSGDTAHPFVVWVLRNHGKDDNTLGDFASEFAPTLPSTGTHDELRRRLYYTAVEWAMEAFDTLWDEYERHQAAAADAMAAGPSPLDAAGGVA